MKNFFKTAAATLTVSFAVLSLSACTVEAPDTAKQEAVRFYTSFVQEATSLEPEAIRTAYSDLEKQNLSNQETDPVRDRIFERFNELNPELFDKLAVEDAGYDTVGATYFNILLMSLNTNGEPVEEVIPLDAVSWDQSSNIYSIDREKITAPTPLLAENTVTDFEGELPPVKLKRDIQGWHVIPDEHMLYEIGVPSTSVR